MFQVGRRLKNIGLLWVLVLACSNILLTVKLLGNSAAPDCGPARPARPAPQAARARAQQDAAEHQDAADPAEPMPAEVDDQDQVPGLEDDPDTITVDVSLGRWDVRRLVKMFDFALVGARFSQLSSEYKVTLATQSSLERIHSLVKAVHHWTGPVSVALYAAGDEWPLVQAYVRYLRRCYAPVRQRVAFHVAFPAGRLPEPAPSPDLLNEILVSEARLNCFRPEQSLKELMRLRSAETTRWRTRHGYPQNHMRNHARKTSQTEYVFLVDVDVVPSLGLAQGLNDFLQTAKCGPGGGAQDGRAAAAALPRAPRMGQGAGRRAAAQAQAAHCAYVIPTYEVDERVRFPRNKSELVRLANQGLARPFHHTVFIHNQFATNFSRWQTEGDADSDPVRVAYNVTNFEFLSFAT